MGARLPPGLPNGHVDMSPFGYLGRRLQFARRVLRISHLEARRRVQAAAAVGERSTLQGIPMPAVRPVLAAAARAGTVNSEHVAIVASALERVDRAGYDPADVAGA